MALAEPGSSWCSSVTSVTLLRYCLLLSCRDAERSLPGLHTRSRCVCARQTVRFCLTDTVKSVFDILPSSHCSLETQRQTWSPRMCRVSGFHGCVLTVLISLLSSFFRLVFPVHSPHVLFYLVCTHVTVFKPSGEKVGVLFRLKLNKTTGSFPEAMPRPRSFPLCYFSPSGGVRQVKHVAGVLPDVFACCFRLSLALSLRVSSLPFPILSFFVSDVGRMFSLLGNCKD